MWASFDKARRREKVREWGGRGAQRGQGKDMIEQLEKREGLVKRRREGKEGGKTRCNSAGRGGETRERERVRARGKKVGREEKRRQRERRKKRREEKIKEMR